MSHDDQHQSVAQVYPPPPGQGYPPPANGYPPAAYVLPAPAPNPAKDGLKAPPVETKDKGDGFWRGWCGAGFAASKMATKFKSKKHKFQTVVGP